jgi:hypothetical protein
MYGSSILSQYLFICGKVTPWPTAMDNIGNPWTVNRATRRRSRARAWSLATGTPIAASPAHAAPMQPQPVRQVRTGTGPVLTGRPALVTVIGLTFRLFPGLQPAASPPLRSVTITDLGLAERDRDLGDGRVANAVVFAVETAGSVADDIAVDWLVLDAQTKRHLPDSPSPERWGMIKIDIEDDRAISEFVIIPIADCPARAMVRVFLQSAASLSAAADESTGRLLLDVADTAAFDPIDHFNQACPDGALPRT